MRLSWLNACMILQTILIIFWKSYPTTSRVMIRNKVTEMVEANKAEKEKKRCCDKRKILLQLTQNLHYEIDGRVHRLLRSSSEIQTFASRWWLILRLHTVCFEHFVILKKIRSIGIASKMTCMWNMSTIYLLMPLYNTD